MKNILISVIMLFNLVFFNSLFAAQAVICNGAYVLCAYAKCVPIPGEKNKVLCTCQAKSGYSIGNKNCDAKPTVNADGYEMLASRYFPVKKYVSCHNNRTWANCYNSQCIVNPKNKTQAFCTCSTVKNKGDYMYATNSCDNSGCESGLISSYVVKDAISDFDSLKTVKNYDKLPGYTPTACPAK